VAWRTNPNWMDPALSIFLWSATLRPSFLIALSSCVSKGHVAGFQIHLGFC
jgi:hypothetical protein